MKITIKLINEIMRMDRPTDQDVKILGEWLSTNGSNAESAPVWIKYLELKNEE